MPAPNSPVIIPKGKSGSSISKFGFATFAWRKASGGHREAPLDRRQTEDGNWIELGLGFVKNPRGKETCFIMPISFCADT